MTKRLMIATVVMGMSSLAMADAKKPPAVMKPPAIKPPPPATAAPKPPAQLEGFKMVAGAWKCDGSVKGPDGKDYKYTVAFNLAPVFGGFWYEATYDRSKVGAYPVMSMKLHMGYDAADKLYVISGIDSWGGWMALTSADGLAYGGYAQMGAAKVPMKWTFGHTGADMTSTIEMTSGTTAMKQLETCKR